jgi:hypothetical protein
LSTNFSGLEEKAGAALALPQRDSDLMVKVLKAHFEGDLWNEAGEQKQVLQPEVVDL